MDQQQQKEEKKSGPSYNNYLGDVWEGNNDTISEAYRDGAIRSIQQHGDDPKMEYEVLQVRFVNESPCHDLILCWISCTGDLYHYYHLAPNGGSRTETTKIGDAFVLFQPPTITTTTAEEKEERGSSLQVAAPEFCHADTVVGAYRPMTTVTEGDSENARLHIVTLSHDTTDHRKNKNDSSSSNNNSQTPTSSWLRGTKKQRVADIHSSSSNDDTTTISSSVTTATTIPGRQSWNVMVQNGDTRPPPPPLKPIPIDTRNKVYHQDKYGSWTVYWEPGCWDENPRETTTITTENKNNEDPTLHQALQADLEAVSQLIPRHVLEVLTQSTNIYMNKTHSYGQAVDNPVGCYHPGKEWLEEHSMNPEKCGQVEFYSVQEYYKHRRLWGTGGIILHELCHAYHQKHLPDGYENPDIRECYEAAMNEGLYESVQCHSAFLGYGGSDGKQHQYEIKNNTKHYACTSPMEYFAELSVAFLSPSSSLEEYNKWYPHNRTQLKEHDPRAFELLQQLWGSS